MLNSHTTRISIATIGLLASTLLGQETPNPKGSPAPPAKKADAANPSEASSTASLQSIIDMYMGQAVENIARRYNLNEEQKAKTAEIMKKGVDKYIQQNEDRVWPVLRDLLASELGRKLPEDMEALQRIGKACGPLAELAEKAILEGNEEWRQYLTKEQKGMHDFDLADMRRQFEMIHKNFEVLAEGRIPDGGIFPAAEVQPGPGRPSKPPPGLPKPEVETFHAEFFDTYVEQFIKDYELDQGQIDSARSILKEYKTKVNEFRDANMAEFAKLDAAIKLARDQKDRTQINLALQQRKEFLEPVYVLFNDMDGRLKGLLRSTQLELYNARRSSSSDEDVRAALEKPSDSTTNDKSDSDESSGTDEKSRSKPSQAPKGNSKTPPPDRR